MDIKYTYKEPEERPIGYAEFVATGGTSCCVRYHATQDRVIVIEFLFNLSRASFNKQDLADLIALLQRFYKQLPEVANADTTEK